MKFRIRYFIIFFIIVTIGLIANYKYRPYIYSNNLYDFGIADTIGSLVCVIGASFSYLSFQTSSKSELSSIAKIIVAMYILELIQLLPFIETFDWQDLVAITISSIITLYIYYKIGKDNKKLKVYSGIILRKLNLR